MYNGKKIISSQYCTGPRTRTVRKTLLRYGVNEIFSATPSGRQSSQKIPREELLRLANFVADFLVGFVLAFRNIATDEIRLLRNSVCEQGTGQILVAENNVMFMK